MCHMLSQENFRPGLEVCQLRSWLSSQLDEQKLETVALSTAEAQYIALSTATQEAVWLWRLTISDL